MGKFVEIRKRKRGIVQEYDRKNCDYRTDLEVGDIIKTVCGFSELNVRITTIIYKKYKIETVRGVVLHIDPFHSIFCSRKRGEIIEIDHCVIAHLYPKDSEDDIRRIGTENIFYNWWKVKDGSVYETMSIEELQALDPNNKQQQQEQEPKTKELKSKKRKR